MTKAIVAFLFLFSGVYSNTPEQSIQLDTSVNKEEFTGKLGIVTCPVPADVKSINGNNCRTSRNVMKEITDKIAICKYLLNNANGIKAFKGSANVSFQITSDGYMLNYKVVKTDIKRKSILKDIENQIRSLQFGKTKARDCLAEITCNFKLKVLTLKNNHPKEETK